MMHMSMFREWVTKTDKTPDELGAEIGVTGQTVRNWMAGIGSPRIKYALKIEEMTKGKIPVSYWAKVA